VHKSCRGSFQFLSYDIDNMLIFKVDRALLGSERDIVVFCAYIPPEGSPYYVSSDVNNGILTMENCMLDVLDAHSDCSVLICGDLNARTGLMNAGSTTDIYNMRYEVAEHTRCSEDSKVNDFGRSLVAVCIAFDLVILNGCVKGDNSGGFTYVSNNGNSVVDYCIVSQELLPMCESFSGDDCILSPHIYLTLKIRSVTNQNFFHVDSGLVRTEKIIWDDRMTELYLSNLRTNLSSSHLSDDIEQGGFVISNAIDTLS